MSITGMNLRQGRTGGSLAYPDFEDLRHAQSIRDMTAYYPFMPAGISGGAGPQRYWGPSRPPTTSTSCVPFSPWGMASMGPATTAGVKHRWWS
jgi:hypothetical protein